MKSRLCLNAFIVCTPLMVTQSPLIGTRAYTYSFRTRTCFYSFTLLLSSLPQPVAHYYNYIGTLCAIASK
jgi:hypothetical protein